MTARPMTARQLAAVITAARIRQLNMRAAGRDDIAQGCADLIDRLLDAHGHLFRRGRHAA